MFRKIKFYIREIKRVFYAGLVKYYGDKVMVLSQKICKNNKKLVKYLDKEIALIETLDRETKTES